LRKVAVSEIDCKVEGLWLVAFVLMELLDEQDELLTGVIENELVIII